MTAAATKPMIFHGLGCPMGPRAIATGGGAGGIASPLWRPPSPPWMLSLESPAMTLITRLLVKDARVRVDMETAQAHAFFALDGAPVDWGRVAAKGYEPPLLPPPVGSGLARGSSANVDLDPLIAEYPCLDIFKQQEEEPAAAEEPVASGRRRAVTWRAGDITPRSGFNR